MTSLHGIYYFPQKKEGLEFCIMSPSHECFFLKSTRTEAPVSSLSSACLTLLTSVCSLYPFALEQLHIHCFVPLPQIFALSD